MGKKATKATKKFAAKGQLKKTIQARQKHNQIKKRAQGRKAGLGKSNNRNLNEERDGEEEGEGREFVEAGKKGKR
jgi:nucleolar complex protein 2